MPALFLPTWPVGRTAIFVEAPGEIRQDMGRPACHRLPCFSGRSMYRCRFCRGADERYAQRWPSRYILPNNFTSAADADMARGRDNGHLRAAAVLPASWMWRRSHAARSIGHAAAYAPCAQHLPRMMTASRASTSRFILLCRPPPSNTRHGAVCDIH